MSDITGLGQVASAGIQTAGNIATANTQADAVKHGQDLQHQQYEETRTDLQGYNTTGRFAQDAAMGVINSGTYDQNAANFTGQMMATIPGQTLQDAAQFLPTAQDNSVVPGSMTEAELEQTPGYQFTLNQGLKATQAAAAARGLGVSGAALKGAATYATGLADNTYKDQFAIQQQQFSDQLNKDQQNFGQANTNFNNILNLRQGQFNQGQTQLGDWNTIANFSQGNLNNKLTFLGGQASLGENAGAQTGSVGASLANSSAALGVAGANAIGNTMANGANALTGSMNSYLNYQQQNKLFNMLQNSSSYGTDSSAFGGGGSNASFSSWND